MVLLAALLLMLGWVLATVRAPELPRMLDGGTYEILDGGETTTPAHLE